ncbi:hypothetical protein [Bacillus sp. P14.5]|uniref:hypothetical protein n=1 Tax=Bacillus sp. P14.5 TaxID=1983400 RepID=UPI0013B0673A|nr:hypothetical protein [Bacillus sp. P14.5]
MKRSGSYFEEALNFVALQLKEKGPGYKRGSADRVFTFYPRRIKTFDGKTVWILYAY